MPIVDLANNPLAIPDAIAKMLGSLPSEETDLPLQIYAMVDASIRAADRDQGGLLLKRLLDGPQGEWERSEGLAAGIRVLRNAATCPDPLLPYLKLTVGWTADLDAITDPLDAPTLRKLIEASPALWQIRGTEEGYAAILLIAMGLRERTFNWFDRRWILDLGVLGEEHQGRDVMLLDEPGSSSMEEQNSNVRIVDIDGDADRTLAANLLRLFRPACERIAITWLAAGSAMERDPEWQGAGSWVAGALSLAASTSAWEAPSRVEALAQLQVYWRIRSPDGGATGALGGLVYRLDEDNYFWAALLLADNEARIYQCVAGVLSTVAIFDFAMIGQVLSPTAWHGVRLVAERVATDTVLTMTVDAEQVIALAIAGSFTGAIGLMTGAASPMECSEYEVLPLPGEVQEV